MEAHFETRKRELLEECRVAPQVFERVLPRLERFLEPFVSCLARREQVEHARMFVNGLLSDLAQKNVESIAYRFGEDRSPLQWFIGMSPWDDEPMREELVRQVGEALGEDDGVIVFDPSSFPKSGRESVGVMRQWCGRLGKIENCQVAVYMAYVSRREHALVDTRLYLPKDWTNDRQRCKKAGVPKGTRYRTRHQLCLDMLQQHSSQLPHQWITGDGEMGRPSWFRRRLDSLGEQYLLSVPSNMLIRDLDADPPVYGGFGRKPQQPWMHIETWTATLDEAAWTKVDVRDGSKGPLVVEVVKRRVMTRTNKRRKGDEEVLVVIRYKDRDDQSVLQTDYYLSNAAPETEVAEFSRVAKAEHRIEECLQRSKSEAGLADYEVRNWKGWHHHQTLSLIATWFLMTEARRGKKMDTGDYAPADPRGYCADPRPHLRMRYLLPHPAGARATPEAQPTRPALPLEKP